MGKMKNILDAYREVFVVLAGEAIVSLITCAVYGIIGAFDYKVVTGAALGSAVIVLNLFILSFSVNRAVNKYIALRGEGDMSDEEAAAFAAEHASQIKLATSGTYVIRTLLMLGALVGAFLLGDYFNVIATVIPMLAYRPIIFVSEILRSKFVNKGSQKGENAAPEPEDKESEVE